MTIGGLQKTTLIDFPGKLACTVFLSGCCFRCPWCYSSELVLPEKSGDLPMISEESFFSFLRRRKGFLEGVCVCGGEPTVNEGLPEFLEKIKKIGYLVKLDTNGSNPEMLEKAISEKLVDYVAMDIKAPKERYAEAAGAEVDIGKIQKSIDVLMRGETEYEFRSTVLPAFHAKKDILAMADWIKGADKYFLQNFRPEKTLNPEFERLAPYPAEELARLCAAISSFFKVCRVR